MSNVETLIDGGIFSNYVATCISSDLNNNVYIAYKDGIKKVTLAGDVSSVIDTGMYQYNTNYKDNKALIIDGDYVYLALTNKVSRFLLSTNDIDSSFGLSGTLNFDSDGISDMQIHNDKIYILESYKDDSSNNITKASRYSLKGAIDTTFGNNGILVISQASKKMIFTDDGDLYIHNSINSPTNEPGTSSTVKIK